jgi:hypothetical protein
MAESFARSSLRNETGSGLRGSRIINSSQRRSDSLTRLRPSRRCSPPASPSIEAAAAQQKHNNDDNEKSCHIHVVSPSANRQRSRLRPIGLMLSN